MPRVVTYRCPDCKVHFDFMHHPVDEPPPDYCPNCKSYLGDGPEKAPVLHINLGKAKNRVVDQVYRNMEAASEARATAAAEMTGASAGELSTLKMTNMKDNLREGDTTSMLNTHQAEKNLSTIQGQDTGFKPCMQTITPPAQEGQISAEAAENIARITSGPAARSTRAVMDSMPRIMPRPLAPKKVG